MPFTFGNWDDTLADDFYYVNSLLDQISDDFYYLNSLLDQISRQQVRKIKIKFHINPPNIEFEEPLRVPTGVFNNRHLVKLKLEGEIVIDNSVSSVNLPNLKELLFFVDSVPYELLEKILKVCPKLQKLSFFGDITRSSRSMYLSSDKLEYLHIGSGNGGEFVIDTPNLKHLVLQSYYSDHYRFVSKPKTLVKADIDFSLVSFFDRNDHYSQAVEIFQWISGVGSVWVDAGMIKVLQLLYDHEKHTISYFNNLTVLKIDYDDLGVVKDLKQLYDDDKLPFFNNLVALKIYFHGPKRCWNDVLILVRVSLNLQYLKIRQFNKLRFEKPDWVANWVEPDFDVLPMTTLTGLKHIKLKCLRGSSNDIAMIDYVLSNVETLELLRVGCSIQDTNAETDKLWQEYKFCRDVFQLPKQSVNCEIHFNGEYLSSSSRGLKMGSLDCQIHDFRP